jgi:hypothetical protein
MGGNLAARRTITDNCMLGEDHELLDQPAPKKARLPSGLPPYLASLYEVPLLTREQEGYLFRKFNYLKYKATKLRQKLDPIRARSSLMEEIENLYDQAVTVKNQILGSATPLGA